MQNIKLVFRMLKTNFKTLISFEFIFKISSILIFTPLFVGCFNIIMNITGYTYLTLENIIPFLSNPKTLIMLFILLILMTLYTMFDITTIIIILDASFEKKKIKVLDAIHISLKKCRKIFFPTNIFIPFMVLFLIPFLNLGVASSFISTIKIPEFILEFIYHNYLLLILFLSIIIILAKIFLRWIYSLHYFVLEDLNFLKAKKKSITLGDKHHLKDLLIVVLFELLSFVIYFILVFLGILLILYINNICNIMWLKSFTTTLIWLFIAFSFIIFSILSTPLSYAIISALYYNHKEKSGEEIKHIEIPPETEKRKLPQKLKIALIIFIILTILGGTVFTYGLYLGKFNLNIEYVRTIEITAHRGSSTNYPENTMSAFIAAKKEGASWIELDVGETKDGLIIVMHDANFKRTTGYNKNIWETTYDEIKDLDAGSFLNKKFKNERIPLLEDVLKWAKENGMKLNIEIKPTGHEKNLEKSVIDLVTECNYRKNVVITSQNYSVLENIKDYDENIETVYVMSIAYGDITKLTKADHFSIEASNVTSSMVKSIHKEGKELYVWTVNNEESIRKMLDLKVDNIITDNIELARDVIYKSKTSDIISEYIKIVESIF